MGRFLLVFLLALVGIFIVDQGIKEFMMLKAMELYGCDRPSLYGQMLTLYETACINMTLVFNKGVAFSMFAFLEEGLKWIQLAMLGGIAGFVLWQRNFCYAFPAGMLLGAGFSNVYDRFLHGGVVDYVYWHCGFDFAIFNFADVMIDVAVLWLLILNLKPEFCKKSGGAESV